MISRYALYDTKQIEPRYGLSSGLPKGVKPRYNVSPTMDEPVIVRRDGTTGIELMKWGLIAQGSHDTNSVFRYKTYNVASEKILTKHSWEIAARQRRCIVPANGFYLLNEDKNQPRAHFVSSKDGSLLSLAAIYSPWTDADGNVRATYSLITTEASDTWSERADRLPIVIAPTDEAAWLDESTTDTNSIYSMFRTVSYETLRAQAVGTDIYSRKIDSPALISELPPSSIS